MRYREKRETARIERCEECGSTATRNNLYFLKGEYIKVYIECADCGAFVARYTLRGYTSNKTYESLLQKLRSSRFNSGKQTMRTIELFGREVKEEFDHVREIIKSDEDKRRMEQIIEEDFRNEL
ncbi:MAG: hypothetical protein R6U43_11760 [Candidatus Krumholzibacteriales bacterium]